MRVACVCVCVCVACSVCVWRVCVCRVCVVCVWGSLCVRERVCEHVCVCLHVTADTLVYLYVTTTIAPICTFELLFCTCGNVTKHGTQFSQQSSCPSRSKGDAAVLVRAMVIYALTQQTHLFVPRCQTILCLLPLIGHWSFCSCYLMLDRFRHTYALHKQGTYPGCWQYVDCQSCFVRSFWVAALKA